MKVDAILTSDWHLREDKPVCRTDNFWFKQWKKLHFISDLQQEYNCPVIHAGDLFHHWKPSPHLLTMAMRYLPEMFYTIYGQHDLPQHNLDLAFKSGVRCLEMADRLTVLSGVHFGQTKYMDCELYDDRRILVMHKLVIAGAPLWPGCDAPTATNVLATECDYDLIVTGDNHQSFYARKNGRLLVNPGSLTRQTTDQIDHKPCVYLWNARDNDVTPTYLPIDVGDVSREHLGKQEERNERIEAFVSRLSAGWDVGLTFEGNLEQFRKKNKIRKSVMDVIRKAIE